MRLSELAPASVERRVKIEPRAVPALEASTPALVIKPIAKAVSSAEYPNAPARGATVLNVSPIVPMLVLALPEATARMSAKCPLSDADSPKAVKALVTTSEVEAKSLPEAVAKCIMPSIPPNMSSVFQPAMAISFMALAASVALNFVDEPSSRALSRKRARSSAAAPLTAPTLDIPASKDIPASIEDFANRPTAVVAALTAAAPAI